MMKLTGILLSIFFLLFFVNAINAQENIASQDAMENDGATKSAQLVSPTPTPEYVLPYPGILPDSPLYFLKAFRDRIVSLLISSPLKKAEFDLLQADKRLNSGVYLVEKGEIELAQSTISKGENYFEEAIIQAQEATKQGHKTADLVQRLSRSATKHQKVLKDLEKKVSKEYKKSFGDLTKRAGSIKKEAEQLTSN